MHIIFPLLLAVLSIDRWDVTSWLDQTLAGVNQIHIPHSSHEDLEEVIAIYH
jgi:hypothetical protein